ncbi:hypothetical protein FISHEDRAFT_56422 [Fistulina hepatica ATCC 64428]|uniref:Uncharacterized protein n=1 Tax=Fistulina hepatica ATCC 64428 TaxID=1128425 RepID=A0A0D7AIR6_9AGAR|nr:hypothetical protein FISHEDRAFT_56422 [Fistulina hepatica ATCC 64428]
MPKHKNATNENHLYNASFTAVDWGNPLNDAYISRKRTRGRFDISKDMDEAETACLNVALSEVHNRRNLESPYYALWSSAFHNALKDVKHVSVAPQHELWVSFSSDGDIGDDIDDDPAADHPVKSTGRLSNNIQASTSGEFEANPSGPAATESASAKSGSTVTVPLAPGTGSLCKPDFVLFLWILEQIANHGERTWTSPTALQIKLTSVAVIVEIKKALRRNLKATTAQFAAGAQEKMTAAQEQVLKQAAHCFAADANVEEVLLIAALGPFWSMTKVTRFQIEQTSWYVDLQRSLGEGSEYTPSRTGARKTTSQPAAAQQQSVSAAETGPSTAGPSTATVNPEVQTDGGPQPKGKPNARPPDIVWSDIVYLTSTLSDARLRAVRQFVEHHISLLEKGARAKGKNRAL